MDAVYQTRSAALRPRLARSLIGLASGAAVLVALWALGDIASEQDLLVFIGFDPDRAAMLTAMTAGGIAAFMAGLLTGQRRLPAVLGVVAIAAFFGPTLRAETIQALAARGDQGTFDPLGFVLTIVTLLVSGLVIGWALATLGAEVRSSLLGTWRRTRQSTARRGPLGLANRRVAGTLGVLVALVVSGSALAQMLDFSPDTLFRVGASGGFGMFEPGPTPDPGSGSPGASPLPTQPLPSNVPRVSFPPGPARPGTIDAIELPAPWTGGTFSVARSWVYLPGDYATSTSRYPVVYLVPWIYDNWERGAKIKELFDGMIASGGIPPTMFVIGAAGGGPYQDTECVNAFDGTSNIETYLSSTLPNWIDSHYRTIADPDHRTLMGFSQGGFCSTMLLFGHPDVFHQAIAFGGYYTAGQRVAQTVNAWRPFGPIGTGIPEHSPILQARGLDPAIRAKLFLVVSGWATQPFYGAEYTAFGNELAADGIPHVLMETPDAHSWPRVREDLPAALHDIAAHQQALPAASIAPGG